MTTQAERLAPVIAGIADQLEATSREVRAAARTTNVAALQSARQTIDETIAALDDATERMQHAAQT